MSIDPAGLEDLARELAGVRRGRPRDANLRRGVSTAYDAVFHHVTLLAVEHVVKSAPQWAKDHMRRSWTHGEIVVAAEMVRARAVVLAADPHAPASKADQQWGPLVDLAAADPDMADAARLFLGLRDTREP